ncbi:MAG TPA: hypothetical protein VHV08_16175, partial [Pirellulales bacterium]|nr:hypothetical protein [Pirellulales bacterium]
PYLNLGVTATGLSNYQTLVKPMMDEQDAIMRQSVDLQRLQHQLRDARDGQAAGGAGARDPRSRGGAGSRFMYYSHYFSPGRQNGPGETR